MAMLCSGQGLVDEDASDVDGRKEERFDGARGQGVVAGDKDEREDRDSRLLGGVGRAGTVASIIALG